jgi:peptidoglycan/LPS O-acetylase OafA/YrhL
MAPISEMTGIAYWGLVGCCGCIVVLLSAITYRWVEHPYLLHLTPGATDRIAPSAAIHDAS